MYIDLEEYITKWEYSNSYIVYSPKAFIEHRHLKGATEYFFNKFHKSLNDMPGRTLEGQMLATTKDAQNAAKMVGLLNGIGQGNILERTLDTIANAFNASIEKTHDEFYTETLPNAHKFKNLFVNEITDTNTKNKIKKLNEFFKLITESLKQIGGYDIDFVRALKSIGAKFIDGFTLDSEIQNNRKRRVEPLTEDAKNAAQSIIKTLSTAAETKISDGVLTSDSFDSTITNIFSTIIGENLAKVMLLEVFSKHLQEINEYLLKEIPDLVLVANNSPDYVLGGQQKTKNTKITSKVDVFSNDAFFLNLTLKDGRNLQLEIGTNFSVKSYKNKNSNIHIVSGTPLRKYVDSNGPEKFYAYNIMAHNHTSAGEGNWEKAFRTLRASLAATYFDSWLTGDGDIVENKGINKAQFLMVNGRVYSVFSIVKKICDKYMQLGSTDANIYSKDVPVSLSIKPDSKKGPIPGWEGSEDPNTLDAIKRSELANKVISEMEIFTSFNSNILN